MELDKELIETRIDIIEQNLNLLDELTSEGYNKFSKSYRDILAAKHALQESIEACIDISNHIICARGLRRPSDYKDIFRILNEESVIDDSLLKKLENMAKFRNLLVHRYSEIETKKLYTIIDKNLDDIRNFVRIALRLVNK